MKHLIYEDMLPGELLIETLSYETSENLYKYTRHVRVGWQIAAMKVLLSRHETIDDIFYQEELFQRKFIPRLKLNTEFIAWLQRNVLESMQSRFSTPKHKLQGSIFLCKLKELSADVISDERVIALFEARYNTWYYRRHPYTDALLTATLGQTQLDNIIAKITSPSPGKTTANIVLDYKYTLEAIASRTPYTNISSFISSLFNEALDDVDYCRNVLAISSTLSSHLTDMQITTLITKTLSHARKDDPADSTYFNHLINISSKAPPDQAYLVFATLLPLLVNSYPFRIMALRTLEAFSTKLNALSVASLITGMMDTLTNENDEHDFFGARKHTLYYLLEPLAFGLTSEQALIMLKHVLITKITLFYIFSAHMQNTLVILTSKLSEKHSDELVDELIVEIIRYLNCSDEERDDIRLILSVSILSILAPRFMKNIKQIDLIIENIPSIIQRVIQRDGENGDWFTHAFDLLTAIAPALQVQHLEKLFTTVLSCTTGHRMEYCQAAWGTLAAIFSKLNQTQKEQVTEKCFSAEIIITDSILSIIDILASQFTSTQIELFFSRLFHTCVQTESRPSPTLLSIITRLTPKLSQEKLHGLFLTLAKNNAEVNNPRSQSNEYCSSHNAVTAAFVLGLTQLQVDTLASTLMLFNPQDEVLYLKSLIQFKLLSIRLSIEQSKAYLTLIWSRIQLNIDNFRQDLLLSNELDMLTAFVPMFDDLQASEIRNKITYLLGRPDVKLAYSSGIHYRTFLLLNAILVSKGCSLSIDDSIQRILSAENSACVAFINESLDLLHIMASVRMDAMNQQQQPTHSLSQSRFRLFNNTLENTQTDTSNDHVPEYTP